MGYTTDFNGEFKLDKPLTKKLDKFLTKLAETRRMKRNIEGYGIDGEFFVDGKGFAGQDYDSTVINGNGPPSTQPGLWCQWTPNEDGDAIEWDGGEKFYNYTEWLQYLIDKILKPNGYVLNGEVEYQGEDNEDNGVITVKDNKVYLNGMLCRSNTNMKLDIIYKSKDVIINFLLFSVRLY